jgi:hypothetical protein
MRRAYGAISIINGKSDIAFGGQRHCRCPVIKPAILIAVAYQVIVTFAAHYIVVQVLYHPSLVSYLYGIVGMSNVAIIG